MKKYITKLIFITIIFFCGCVNLPQEALNNINDNSIICDAFIVKMQKGQTTRDQDQAFIRANRRAWHAQNFAINEAPLPPDMQTSLNTGPLDFNLITALENDLLIRKKMQDLQNAFDGIGSINSNK